MKAFDKINTIEELKDYLDNPFWKDRGKFVYHYTSIQSLSKILKHGTLKLSQIKNMNDKIEAQYAKDCKDYFACFMRGEIDTLGMWSMYGGLPSKNAEKILLGDYCKRFVKIKFPLEQLRTICKDKDKNLSLRKIFYCGMLYSDKKSPDDKLILKCGDLVNKNFKVKDLADFKKKLPGYFKDSVWSYENEIRLCHSHSAKDGNKKSVCIELGDDIFKELEVIVSPFSNVPYAKKLLETYLEDDKAEAKCVKFIDSDYSKLIKL